MKLCLQCNYLLDYGGPSDTEERSCHAQYTVPGDHDPIEVSQIIKGLEVTILEFNRLAATIRR